MLFYIIIVMLLSQNSITGNGVKFVRQNVNFGKSKILSNKISKLTIESCNKNQLFPIFDKIHRLLSGVFLKIKMFFFLTNCPTSTFQRENYNKFSQLFKIFFFKGAFLLRIVFCFFLIFFCSDFRYFPINMILSKIYGFLSRICTITQIEN